jgi:hypothetical protein
MQVIRVTGNNILPSYVTSCVSHTTPANDRSTGIANSDLHMYATAAYEPTMGYLAYAAYCD